MQAVAGMGGSGRVVAAGRGVVEWISARLLPRLPQSKNSLRLLWAEIGWAQNCDVAGKPDLLVRITRREIDINDWPLPGGGGIDGVRGTSDQQFVTEREAAPA